MSGLVELIARLEKATGPDRELFELAYFACFGKVDKHDNDAMARWLWFSRLLDAAAWTDAALTLVPEASRWSIDCDDVGTAVASAGPDENDTPQSIGIGATPALALCIAALKSRAPNLPEGEK